MQYFVIGPDGKEYGPATIDTLKQWAAENRLAPTSMLKDAATGQTVAAGSVAGLFAPTPPPLADPVMQPNPYQQPQQGAPQAGMYQNPSPYHRPAPTGQWAQPPGYSRAMTAQDNSADKAQLVGVIFRVGVALLLVSILRYAGLITSLYACYYAFTQANGNRYGVWMIALAIGCLLIVGLLWMLRFQGLVPVGR